MTQPDAAHLFNPTDVTWNPVSNRLISKRFADLGIAVLVLGGGALVLGWLVGRWWAWLPLAVVAVFALWVAVLIPRQVRALGFAERDDDLLVRRGIMFRNLVVVPYGRMQFVDVEAGPLDRMFNLASLQLHTASAHTDAAIPGLDPAEAARLRDRLAARGEAKLAGL